MQVAGVRGGDSAGEVLGRVAAGVDLRGRQRRMEFRRTPRTTDTSGPCMRGAMQAADLHDGFPRLDGAFREPDAECCAVTMRAEAAAAHAAFDSKLRIGKLVLAVSALAVAMREQPL
jgi:hypothetical protein